MKCDKDGTEMKVVSRVKRFLTPEEVQFDELTDGQQSEYLAAEMNEGLQEEGEWTIDVVTYGCPKCGAESTSEEVS